MTDTQPEPLTLHVPLGRESETDLMAALDYVMWAFSRSGTCRPLEDDARARAADWLHAKYGSKP